MAWPLRPEDELLHQLEPEQRLVAAVFLRAISDVEDRDSSVRSEAQAFLKGAGSFSLLCDLGGLDPARVSRLAISRV